MSAAEERIEALGYEPIAALKAGKRCGVQWTPWMGDFFTSWSPRNDNTNAEGPWDHWVDLALSILSDPLTAVVRPEAHAAVADIAIADLYTEVNRALTYEELELRFSAEIANEEARRDARRPA